MDAIIPVGSNETQKLSYKMAKILMARNEHVPE